MKIYRLPLLAELNPNSECSLGPDEIGGTVYLTYGRLRPKETSKSLSPGAGREEIICVLKGSIRVNSGKTSFTIGAGEAFHSKEAQVFLLDNVGDDEAVYIATGAVSPPASQADAVKPESRTEEAETVAGALDVEEYEISMDDGPGDEEEKAG